MREKAQSDLGPGRKTLNTWSASSLTLLALLSAASSVLVRAQSANSAPTPVLDQAAPQPSSQALISFAPVTAEELALKDTPLKDGSAAILLNREMHFDDQKHFETVYYRIKILKDEGKKYADVQLPYVGKSENIEDIKARTTSPNGSSAEFKGQVLDQVVVKAKRVKLQAKTFTLPGVETGSIIEYSYKLTWHDKMPDWVKNPSRYMAGKYTYSVPTVHWVLQEEMYTRHALFTFRPYPDANANWVTVRPPEKVEVIHDGDGTYRLEVRNVPALEKEDDMPPEGFLNSRLHFTYIVGYAQSQGYFWAQQARQMAEELDKFLAKNNVVRKVVSETVSPGDSADEKIRKLYNRAQRLRNTTYEPARTDAEVKRENVREAKNVDDILSRGFGIGNEMNYVFVAMLRAAGFKAWILRLTGRGRGVFDASVLDIDQLDAMVVMIEVGDKTMFLDPATKFCPYGLIPWEETGVQALRIDKDLAGFVQIPGKDNGTTVLHRTADLTLAPDGRADGRVQVSFSGQEALARRRSYYDEDDAGRQKALEDEVKKWLPSETSVEITGVKNWDDVEKDLVLECRIAIPHLTSMAGRRRLLPPAIFQANNKNPFQHPERKYAIYFDYPFHVIDDITFAIPEGYAVESTPAGHNDTTVNVSHFQTSFNTSPGKVQFQRNFTINGFFYPVSSYGQLRGIFGATAASDAEQLVLTAEASGQK
jgi:hypothetical protein